MAGAWLRLERDAQVGSPLNNDDDDRVHRFSLPSSDCHPLPSIRAGCDVDVIRVPRNRSSRPGRRGRGGGGERCAVASGEDGSVAVGLAVSHLDNASTGERQRGGRRTAVSIRRVLKCDKGIRRNAQHVVEVVELQDAANVHPTQAASADLP